MADQHSLQGLTGCFAGKYPAGKWQQIVKCRFPVAAMIEGRYYGIKLVDHERYTVFQYCHEDFIGIILKSEQLLFLQIVTLV